MKTLKSLWIALSSLFVILFFLFSLVVMVWAYVAIIFAIVNNLDIVSLNTLVMSIGWLWIFTQPFNSSVKLLGITSKHYKNEKEINEVDVILESVYG